MVHNNTNTNQSINQYWFVTLNQSINENIESGMESNGKWKFDHDD